MLCEDSSEKKRLPLVYIPFSIPLGWLKRDSANMLVHASDIQAMYELNPTYTTAISISPGIEKAEVHAMYEHTATHRRTTPTTYVA